MQRKFSRQREEILAQLKDRKDHPTADMIYDGVRLVLPRISLGTVYRNLSLLSEEGSILRLRFRDGIDHFDYTSYPHVHFYCLDCGSVEDFDDTTLNLVHDSSMLSSDYQVTACHIHYEGYCPSCQAKKQIQTP